MLAVVLTLLMLREAVSEFSEPLEGTTDDNEDRYPYVVALCYNHTTETPMTLFGEPVYRACSGSLIKEDWVLTAARCGGRGMSIRFGDMTLPPNQTSDYRKVLTVVPFPNKEIGYGVLNYNDISLLWVEKVPLKVFGKISGVEYTTMIGNPVKYVGFGMDLRYGASRSVMAKAVREAQTARRKVREGMVKKCTRATLGKLGTLSGAPKLCWGNKCANKGVRRGHHGDSGGPVIHMGKIAAVCHGVSKDLTEFIFTPVTPYLDWIYRMISCTTHTPDPPEVSTELLAQEPITDMPRQIFPKGILDLN